MVRMSSPFSFMVISRTMSALCRYEAMCGPTIIYFLDENLQRFNKFGFFNFYFFISEISFQLSMVKIALI